MTNISSIEPDVGLQQPPGPPIEDGVKVATDLMADPLMLVQEATNSFGEIVFLPGVDMYLITEPDLLKKIIIDDEKIFSKSPEVMEKISPAIGKGLSTLIGPEWKKHRRMATPAFTRQSVTGFFDIFRDSIQETMEEWDSAGDGEIDITEQMKRLTLRIVIRCLFSTDIDAYSKKVIESLELLQAYSVYRLWSPNQLPETSDDPLIRSYRNARIYMEGLIDEIIANRHATQNEGRTDLLSLFMIARDPETGDALSDEKVRHEVMNMFLAGHETTANAVAFGFYLLAKHPEILKNLQNELKGVDLSKVQFDDLHALDLTDRTFKESLRLFPSSWGMSRVCLEDYAYGDYLIPKGADIIVAQWCLHRSERHWENAEVFDPDRFLPERIKNVHKYAYMPFGAGARKCVGVHLADCEGRMIIAMLAQNYDFHITEKTELNLKARLFMTSDPGVTLGISKRT